MTLADAVVHLYHPDSHDDIARCYGWSDFAQMSYYENRQEEAPPMTDNEIEQLVEREEALAVDGKVEYLAPPPSEILVLARQDPREIYTDSEDCPRDGDFEHTNWQDLSGVY